MKKFTGIIIIFFISTQLVFASYEEALKLYQEKKYKESLKILGDELVTEEDYKEGSPNYKLRFLAAHNHWKLGNEQSVVIHFNKCIAIAKKSVDPYIDLGLYFLEINQLHDAQETASRGLEIKEDAMLYFIMGSVEMRRKNFWRAKELLEKANSLNSDLYISYNSLGMVLMNLRKFGDADAAFMAAYTLNPDSSEILNNLGVNLEKMSLIIAPGTGEKVKREMLNEAYSFLKKAVSLDPANATIKKNFERISQRLKS